jgi:hypothetical protein
MDSFKNPITFNQPIPNSIKSKNYSKEELKINDLIQKCNEVQKQRLYYNPIPMKKTSDFIKKPYNQDFFFTGSNEFKLQKIRLKEKMKIKIGNKYSERLLRLKSIISNDGDEVREFLSPEDIQNNEAAIFLSLNKREFGNLSPLNNIKYSKPNKIQKQKTKVDPIETVLDNIKTMNMNHKKTYTELDYSIENPKAFLVTKHISPRDKFIQNELSKIWSPSAREIVLKKPKILNIKVSPIVKPNKKT